MSIYKFGVTDVTSGDAVGAIIWRGHTVASVNPFPAATGALTAVSSSTDDDVGGAGTTEVIADCLVDDGSGNMVPQYYTIAMDGTTPVAVAASGAFRCHRAHCSAGVTNVGDIDIKIGSEIVARIPAAIGQTEQATYTTGTATRAKLRNLWGRMLKNAGSTPSALIKLWIRPHAGPGPWRVYAAPITLFPENGPPQHEFKDSGLVTPAGVDMKMQVDTFTGTSATIAAGFDLL